MGALTTVLTVVETLARLAPEFVRTWDNLKPFATDLFKQLSGAEPTEAEVADMEARIDALAAQLQVPLPEAQPGDPDYQKDP